jgi:HEAT repeat protein
MLEDDSNRPLASEALLKIGTPAEPVLIKALIHARPAVRREACEVLAKVGTAASLVALQTRTFDEDREVAAAATRAKAAITARANAAAN